MNEKPENEQRRVAAMRHAVVDDARRMGFVLAAAGTVGLFVDRAPFFGAVILIELGVVLWGIGVWYIKPPTDHPE